ncbi:hypothetical protein NKR23_g7399 [Pleurostoma richardsiae]|uniref:2EXR domain-containing protein n=1 Tax=Pleurostoma richardsiae TaxID=41990 RepID=A0AA38R8F5_9PEZI|nr:hypothetical protein NKR23_g7399 [Pleurostoma richardsiae]
MSEEFRDFNRLPAEIRTMIWELSLPEPRVYEILDAPNARQRTPAQQGLMFANVHPEPPPALAAVCRDSRYFVLRHYKPLMLGETTKFVDFSRDMLLLEPYLLVKRLHRTLHFMSQVPLVRDNITRLAMGTSYGFYTGICHPILSWKVLKNNMGKLLAKLAEFPRLAELVFIVHQEFQFEFDFRYPHLSALSHHQQVIGTTTILPHILPSLPAQLPVPPPPSSPASSPAVSVLPAPPSLPPSVRPQLIHQGYRFKFDIEANINHHPRRPHFNELQYYPLEDRDWKDDWDIRDLLLDVNEDGEDYEDDPCPTNDDWRRFRRRFLRAVYLTISNHYQAGGSGGSSPHKALNPPARLPALKGARLLWRYTRGAYA